MTVNFLIITEDIEFGKIIMEWIERVFKGVQCRLVRSIEDGVRAFAALKAEYVIVEYSDLKRSVEASLATLKMLSDEINVIVLTAHPIAAYSEATVNQERISFIRKSQLPHGLFEVIRKIACLHENCLTETD